MTLRVLVIGASGIGRIHVREFLSAGTDVFGVVGSSMETSRQTADTLSREYSRRLIGFENLQEALNHQPDIVAICSPHELHFPHMKKVLSFGAAVFCEKPLFWNDFITLSDIDRIAIDLEPYAHRIGINFPNVHFLKAATSIIGVQVPTSQFAFSFFTNGMHEGEAIGVDLLPHAFAMMQTFGPLGKVRVRDLDISSNQFHVRLDVGNIRCDFDLRESTDSPKHLGFAIDGHNFERHTSICDRSYQVALLHSLSSDLYPVEDPFRTNIMSFLSSTVSGRRPEQGLLMALENLRAMVSVFKQVGAFSL